MDKTLEADVTEIIENPAAHFEAPADVVEHPALSEEEKRKALDTWEEDARLLSVATQEGMSGGTPSKLAEVAEAKSELNAERAQNNKPKRKN